MSYLVQILLPLRDNAGKRLSWRLYRQTEKALTEKFNGLTAYARAPADGLWKPRRVTRREEIVVYEVMTSALDKQWWKKFRLQLEKKFQQETVVIRAERTELL